MFTTEFIIEVVKWTAILFGAFIVLCGIFVKSDNSQNVDNDPTHFPPIIP